MPSSEPTLYDYTIQVSGNIKIPAGWIPWKRIIPPYVPRLNQPFSEILVPTVDTERQKWLLNLLALRGLPVLIVGDSGTSKSATINDFLRGVDRDEWITTRLNFSSFTTSGDVQTSLEANLEKRTKDVYGPPARKKMVFSVDDLNMPQLDEYGTQKPLAFLRFLLEKSAFYDRQKTLALKRVTDIGYVAAMVTNGGGVKKIDPRFISLFSVFNMAKASDDSLCHIYSSLFMAHVERHFPQLRDIVFLITDASLELYTTACQVLPPTPTKFQYTFNLRDTSKVYQGLCSSSEETVQNFGDLWRLWRNESIRVYCDRMAAVEDQVFVRQTVQGLIERYSAASDLDRILREPLIYGDFATNFGDDSNQQPPYQDLVNYEAAQSILEEIMLLYNTAKPAAAKHMIFFHEAIDHFVRIKRILSMQQGHAFLIGVGGSGKQSLTQLAAFASGMDFFEISLQRGYNLACFVEDVKSMFKRLGIDNKRIVFFLADKHIIEEDFLEIVNSILSSGQIPPKFADEEKEDIIGKWRKMLNKY